MKDLPIIWLLLNTDVGKTILGIFIALFIVVIFGWWLIPIIGILIAIVILHEYYDRLDLYKNVLKRSEEECALKIKHNQTSKANYQKVLESHPLVAGDVIYKESKMVYNLYWLAIGRFGKREDKFENNCFRIEFSISKDFLGLVVTFKNISNESFSIDWQSFTINGNNVQIDGVDYVDYTSMEKLCHGESITRLVQLHNLYWPEDFKQMFDCREMKKGEVMYHVEFSIVENKEPRAFVFDLYTQHKRIYFNSSFSKGYRFWKNEATKTENG